MSLYKVTQEEVERFKQAQASAHWRLTYFEFCRALGWEQDDWSAKKFIEFSQLRDALAKFDSQTLTTILNAVR